MRKELQSIINYQNHILNKVSMSVEYENWSDEFRLKEIFDGYNKFCEQVIDFRQFTKDELFELGFGKFDDEDNSPLLMPLWAFHICKDGIELTCIDGEKKIKGKDKIDTDVRFGCIAWGLTPNELLKFERKTKLSKIEKEAQK